MSNVFKFDNSLNMVSLYAKIKTLTTMLWESEHENSILKMQLYEKDKIIKDLNTDIYFSDMEVKDMQNLIDSSQDMNYLFELQNKIIELEKSNEILSNMIQQEFTF